MHLVPVVRFKWKTCTNPWKHLYCTLSHIRHDDSINISHLPWCHRAGMPLKHQVSATLSDSRGFRNVRSWFELTWNQSYAANSKNHLQWNLWKSSQWIYLMITHSKSCSILPESLLYLKVGLKCKIIYVFEFYLSAVTSCIIIMSG